MKEDQKQQVIHEALRYCKDKHLSNNQLAQLTGINPAYISNMLRGEFTVSANNKTVAIKDSWFEKLAAFIGLNLGREYWASIPTDEFVQIFDALTTAKDTGATATIIAPTGTGKTFAIDKFLNKNPLHTFRVTVNHLYTTQDIIRDLMGLMNLTVLGRPAHNLVKVQLRLRELRLAGGEPMVILDEAENLRLPVLRMLKALYDGIKNHASIVLIGTDQLTQKLDKMEQQDREGMPQFCRRFKAGRRFIMPSDNPFEPFFERLKITDAGLKKLLKQIARNYGELADYLEPALREADRRGLPITEDFFRLLYNMPKR